VLQNGRLIGMITDRDIAVRGVAEGHGPDTPVSELMTNDVVAARLDDDVDEVAVRMSEAQVRRLPVIDDSEQLCGIVSIGDITQKAEDGTAELALEGITEPGGDHQQ
jgi:CBS domain-containing protein